MFSTILLILVLILFGIYIYKHPPSSKSKTIPTTPSPTSPIPTNICMDYSGATINQLEVDLVRNMITGYKNHQKKHIDAATGLDDAHSIWFDLEVLKKFIYHTEYNTLQNSISGQKPKLGLRIHYSRYPEFKNWNNYKDLNDLALDPIGKLYGEHHTLIMIPTIKRNDGKNVNFNPLDIDTYEDGMPFDYPGTPSTTTVPVFGAINKQATNSNTTTAQNHGGLYPPHTINANGY